jgi:prepilin-type N-terminal cleavage/methylation domain-containing protein
MTRNRAFTLIEVLMVVAIVAIMAALLFPVLTKARSRAYLVQDVSQMRQIYVAVDLYSSDNEEHLPPSLLYVAPYAKSTEVFASPADPYRRGIPGVPDFPANMYDGADLRSPFRISYAFLVPMAAYYGLPDLWINERRNDPGYGLLALSMYNDRAYTVLPACQIDYYRWQFTEHRIRMDGSYQAAHVQAGVSWTCSIPGCFGDTGEPAPNPPDPAECPSLIPRSR